MMTSTTNETVEPAAEKKVARKPAAKAGKPVHGLPKPVAAKSTKSKKPAPAETKTEIVLKRLRAGKGASIDQLVEATGWQEHSVRGFLSATVRKKLALTLTSDVGKDGIRRYRIDAA